jgi:TonB family protein
MAKSNPDLVRGRKRRFAGAFVPSLNFGDRFHIRTIDNLPPPYQPPLIQVAGIRMRIATGLMIFAAVTTSGLPAGAQNPPVPIVPPSGAAGPGALMVILKTGAVTCDGQSVTPVYSEALTPEITPLIQGPTLPEAVLAFSIDPAGRPRDIRPDAVRANTSELAVFNTTQLIEDQASLAAWRFPAAGADCRLTIRRVATPLAHAPEAAIAPLLTSTLDRRWRAAVTARLQSPGDDCADRPDMLAAVYPDRRKVAAPAGGRVWTVLRWDILPDGHTTDVETVTSSGDPVFDAEGRRAVSDSLFVDSKPRTGCITVFSQTGAPLGNTPEPEPTGDPLQDCPADVRARYTPGRLTYPEAFRRRGIEGWAIVRYDIASWGQVGGVTVLTAQPAAAFGEAARQVIASGRATPGFAAAVRCTDRVIFRMPVDGQEPNTD